MNIADIWKYDLRQGNSNHPRDGACLFDAGMWLVYGRIGDNPPCSCPVIRSYAIGLNDKMPHGLRQKLLKPYILRVVGNRDPAAEQQRFHTIVLETARRVVPLASNLPEFAALRFLPDDASYSVIKHAVHAAYAAAYAVHAAHAAVHAAHAAYAAVHAVHAAAYAAHAAHAAYAAVHAAAAWQEAVNILDMALRIGKQSPEFDEMEVRKSVTRFAEVAAL